MNCKHVAFVSALLLGATAPMQIVQAAPLLLRRPTSSTEGAGKTADTVDFRHGFSAVAEQATPAVVFIQVEKQIPASGRYFFNNPFDLFGEEFSERFFGRRGYGNRQRTPLPRQFKQIGQGSGFLISKDGYILTNTHVVGDVDRITVKLSDGREFKAKRIGADSRTEIALIKIESDKDLPYLKTGDSDKLKTGEWVIAIGNPFGLKETLTVGVVSAKGRSGMNITDYEDFIQTDAAINPGNSGGPLLNVDGEVVGINTAIYSRTGGYMGIGFAVPISMAINIKDQLMKHGKVTRGYVGVMLNPDELSGPLAKSLGYDGSEGALIADVVENGPADKAGMKSGDIVVELNGKKITDNMHFRNEVARIMPSSKANVTVIRDGKEKKLTITVASFPDELDKDSESDDDSPADILDKVGMEVQELTSELARELELEKVKHGVVIAAVQPGGIAEEAGFKAGMVIIEADRNEVKSIEDLKKCAGKAKDGSLLLRVKTPQGTFFKSLPLED